MTTTKKLEGLAPRRRAVGMSQQAVANALGVERATVGMWETGANWPSARILPALADVLLIVNDGASSEMYKQHDTVMQVLSELGATEQPRIEVVNKCDLGTAEPTFPGAVMVSAKTGDGLEELTRVMAEKLPVGPKYFPDDMMTDQPERLICAEIIREKALLHLREEVPHGVGVEMMRIEKLSDNMTEIHATIYCERDAHKGIIIGKQGAMLKKISSMARNDCEKFMGTKVFLTVWVKVKENWRDSDFLVRNFGYSE